MKNFNADSYSHELTRATEAIMVEMGQAVFTYALSTTPDERHGMWTRDIAGWAVIALTKRGYDIVLRCTFCRDNGTVQSEPDDHDEGCCVRRAMIEAGAS